MRILALMMDQTYLLCLQSALYSDCILCLLWHTVFIKNAFVSFHKTSCISLNFFGSFMKVLSNNINISHISRDSFLLSMLFL